MNTIKLKEVAKNVRIDVIEALAAAKSGHPGGSLSVTDILTVLYFDKMNIDPKNPKMEDRDRLVLSKGHVAPALYSVLAERGYFPKENLVKLRKFGSMLQGHPDMKSTPGIDMSTGSLGQGLSAANGMALAAKLDKKDYVIAILDFNGLQIDGSNEEVMNINPIGEKFSAFGWNVIRIDGHNLESIGNAVDEAKTVKGKPTIIIAKTIKGKGVSFMENNVSWHGTAPNEEQRKMAIEELERGEA